MMGPSMAWAMWGSALVWFALSLGLIAGIWGWWTQWRGAIRHDDPQAILSIRLRRGEISVREYEHLRALLREREESPRG